ncbi:MAG: efflux RND transporter permease subunit, partial [Pseudomonadota bacterium]
GAEVALGEVVSMRDARGFSRIKRDEGRRTVAITAELDAAVTNTTTVLDALRRDGIDEIAAAYGLNVVFKGKAEEQAETFADMSAGAILGLALIYIILAWVFASYTRPILVMAIIPLGFVGAALGHWFLGYDITILSMVALIGLSGIVINDSIVLVTTIDERRKSQSTLEAAVDGSCDRLRAVLLTSLTTIGGLTPLLFETSLQAQFLIPMALTIVAGLAVATLVVLILVPALVLIQQDIGNGRRWIWHVLGRYVRWATTSSNNQAMGGNKTRYTSTTASHVDGEFQLDSNQSIDKGRAAAE